MNIRQLLIFMLLIILHIFNKQKIMKKKYLRLKRNLQKIHTIKHLLSVKKHLLSPIKMLYLPHRRRNMQL